MKTTDERLDHVERVLDEHTDLLTALNEQAARQTGHLATMVEQLRRMNDGIIRALTDAAALAANRAIEGARLDALEERVEVLERRR